MLRITTSDGSVITVKGSQSDLCCGTIEITGIVTIQTVPDEVQTPVKAMTMPKSLNDLEA